MAYTGAICWKCKKPIAMPGACFVCNLASTSLIETVSSTTRKQTSVQPRERDRRDGSR